MSRESPKSAKIGGIKHKFGQIRQNKAQIDAKSLKKDINLAKFIAKTTFRHVNLLKRRKI